MLRKMLGVNPVLSLFTFWFDIDWQETIDLWKFFGTNELDTRGVCDEFEDLVLSRAFFLWTLRGTFKLCCLAV